jgi:3-phytase
MRAAQWSRVLAVVVAGGVLAAACGVLWTAGTPAGRAAEPPAQEPAQAVAPSVTLHDPAMRDQDDMCIWAHPTDGALSTVITSDKAADKLFVYDLTGRTIQTLPSQHPGNIDVRYGFALGGKKVDIVAFNKRPDQIHVYAVDGDTRKLTRVDNGAIETGENYGGTMFRSPKTGKSYFITTCNGCQQYELYDDGKGKVAGRLARRWATGYSEGAVGDDEAGKIYTADEAKGIWEIGGEPNDPAPGKLIARVGEHGLRADVEGLAIYRQPGGKGYLIASSQGNSRFNVYRREGAHEFVGTFAIRGARETDGIDVCSAALGPAFPKGMFACHTDRSGGCPNLLIPWEAIAASLTPPLAVDTTCPPRK